MEQSKELEEMIHGFIKKLPTEDRRIFVKRYWYMKSIAGIAEEEGLKDSTIKMRLLRIREQLRVELERGNYL